MRIQVECYAGGRADERPLRFRLGERVVEVDQVIDQWRSPSHERYKVRATDGTVYVIERDWSTPDGDWTLVG